MTDTMNMGQWLTQGWTWFGLELSLISVLAVASVLYAAMWMARNKQRHLKQEQQAEQQQYEQTAQTQALELARLQEREHNLNAHIEQLQDELNTHQQALSDVQQNNAHLREQLASAQQARTEQAKHYAEKEALLIENKEALLKEFKQLSQDVFDQKQQQWLQQQQQQAEQFTQQSKQGLDALLTPFKESLEGLRKRVDDVHTNDVKDRAQLKAQLESLHTLNQQMSSEAHSLATALRGEQKTQGNWGEMVLETVLERSGLRQNEEYVREQSQTDDDGQRFRPDVIIQLPDNKHIVVDAKVSLVAYTDYVNCDDEQQKSQHAKRHVESVRQHIKGLSAKSYQHLKGLNSPDFVFLFMPLEPAFMLAFQEDERLFNEAFEQRIVVVTPTTLLATLRTVSSVWALERRNQSTEKLADLAGKVYDKLATVLDKFETLGKQLNTAQNTYDGVWSSLKSGRGNLINQADTFRKLGVRVKKELNSKWVEDAQSEHELYSHLAEIKQAPEHERNEVLDSDTARD